MFNLPTFTLAVLLGVPVFWIVYAAVFLRLSRHYKRADSS